MALASPLLCMLALLLQTWTPHASANQTQQALLIASPITRSACGGYNLRASYVVRRIGYGNRFEVLTARLELEKELQVEHGVRIVSENVYAGQCIAIARTRHRVNECRYDNHMWRSGPDAGAAEAALLKDIRGTSSVVSHSIEHVHCLPINKDVASGVRG
jgi:hypothetical protein